MDVLNLFSLKPVSSLEQFQADLAKANEAYLLEKELPATGVSVIFSGPVNGQDVVWNAYIQTIEDYSQNNDVDKDPKQFIDIQVQAGVHFLQVGLNLEVIDKAAIERTIIMVRNYKRLRLGRHEYGARSKTE